MSRLLQYKQLSHTTVTPTARERYGPISWALNIATLIPSQNEQNRTVIGWLKLVQIGRSAVEDLSINRVCDSSSVAGGV